MREDHDLLRRFADYLQFDRQYSEHTVRGYLRDVSAFFSELFPSTAWQKELPAITVREVRLWVVALGERGRSPRSVNRSLSALSHFFTFSCKMGFCTSNPVEGVPRLRTATRIPTFLREQETQRLFSQELFPEGWNGLRDRLLLLMLYSLGLRRSELASLRWADYEAATRQVRIRGKGDKDRLLPVTDELARELSAYRRATAAEFHRAWTPTDAILRNDKGEPVTGDFVYAVVRRYLAMVSTHEHRSPHVLRHTFATHLLQGGADIVSIKDLLGHESLGTTQVYTHTDLGMLRDAYRRAHPRETAPSATAPAAKGSTTQERVKE